MYKLLKINIIYFKLHILILRHFYVIPDFYYTYYFNLLILLLLYTIYIFLLYLLMIAQNICFNFDFKPLYCFYCHISLLPNLKNRLKIEI